MSKTANGLVDFVRSKLGTNYVYGMKGAVMTQAKYNELKAAYGSYVWESDKNKIGTVCVDCSGLISWYTGTVRGSSQYKSTAVNVLTIDKLGQAVQGCLLWKAGHIGIYIGNGRVIEAKGSAYGVVETTAASTAWTHILWGCDINYGSVTLSAASGGNSANTNKAGHTEDYSKFAAGTYITTVTSLNVRTGPGTGYAKKSRSQLTANGQANSNANGQLNRGTAIDVSKVFKVSDGEYWGLIPSGYIALMYNGESYVSRQGNPHTSIPASAGGYSSGKTYTVITAAGVNVRRSASTSGAKLKAIPKGTRLTCTSVVQNGTDIWLKYADGYVCAMQGNRIYIQ